MSHWPTVVLLDRTGTVQIDYKRVPSLQILVTPVLYTLPVLPGIALCIIAYLLNLGCASTG